MTGRMSDEFGAGSDAVYIGIKGSGLRAWGNHYGERKRWFGKVVQESWDFWYRFRLMSPLFLFILHTGLSLTYASTPSISPMLPKTISFNLLHFSFNLSFLFFQLKPFLFLPSILYYMRVYIVIR